MSKFNVGDKVSWTKYNDCWQNATVLNIVADGVFKGECRVECLENGVGIIPEDELTLVSRPGPIRTVTRREIVPGVYGRLHILKVTDENKVYVNLNEDGDAYTRCRNTTSMSATELREAAHVLNQLAEVLEDE